MPHNLRSKSLDTSHLFSIQEVADYLKVCQNTVRALLKKGKLDAVKVGSQWRVGKASLENYLNGATTNHQQWGTELYQAMTEISTMGAAAPKGELAQRLKELCTISKLPEAERDSSGHGASAQRHTDSPQKRAAQTYFSPKVTPVIIPNTSSQATTNDSQRGHSHEPLSTDDLFD